MKQERIPLTTELRDYLNNFLGNYSRITSKGFAKTLGISLGTVRYWRGTQTKNGKPSNTIPLRAITWMKAYVRDPNIKRRVEPECYVRGVKNLEGRYNNHEHFKNSLYFLRKFHPEETGQILGLEQKLYALSPKAIALKEEDKMRRPEVKEEKAEKSKKTLLVNALLNKLTSEKKKDISPVETFYLALCHASRNMDLSNKLNKSSLMVIKDIASYIVEFNKKGSLDEIDGENEHVLIFLSNMFHILKKYHPNTNYLVEMSRFMHEVEGVKNGDIPHKSKISNFLRTFTKDMRYSILLERYAPEKIRKQIEELEKGKKAEQEEKKQDGDKGDSIDDIVDEDGSTEEEITYMTERYPGLIHLIQTAMEDTDYSQDRLFSLERQHQIAQSMLNPGRGGEKAS